MWRRYHRCDPVSLRTANEIACMYTGTDKIHTCGYQNTNKHQLIISICMYEGTDIDAYIRIQTCQNI